MENYNEFMEDYKNYLIAIRNLSQGSVKKVITTVKQFLGFINNYKFDKKFDSVEDINLNDIRMLSNNDVYSYIFYLAENDYKPITRSAKVEYLRSFFEFLFKIKHKLFKQPFPKIKTEKRFEKHLPNYLSYEEAKKLVNVYNKCTSEQDIRNNAIIHLCLHCGMRISEVAELNLSDLQLSERKFLILGKGNKERTGYLNDSAYNALVKYLEIRKNIKPKHKKDGDKVFITKKLTKIRASTIRECIKQAYIDAGINNETYSVHTLRHTCATLMFKAGTDIKTIQEILGHSTVDVTKIYTHLYNKEVEEALQGHPLSQFKYNDAIAYAAA